LLIFERFKESPNKEVPQIFCAFGLRVQGNLRWLLGSALGRFERFEANRKNEAISIPLHDRCRPPIELSMRSEWTMGAGTNQGG